MKLFFIFYRTILYLAIEKENVEIVKLLLSNDKIDANIPYIFGFFYIKFKIISLNYILNHFF